MDLNRAKVGAMTDFRSMEKADKWVIPRAVKSGSLTSAQLAATNRPDAVLC